MKAAWHIDRIKAMRDGGQAVPVSLQLILSDYCNHDCYFCFPAGTLILTEDGYEPIESVEEGQRVFSHNGVLKPVLKTMIRQYSGELICIRPQRFGSLLRMTPNHPLLTLREGDRALTWRTAEELKEGDRLALRGPVKTHEVESLSVSKLLDGIEPCGEGRVRVRGAKTNCFDGIPLNAIFGEWVGAFLGDGHVQRLSNRPGSYLIRITLGAHQREIADRLVAGAVELFGVNASIDDRSESGSTLIVGVNSSIIGRLLTALCRAGSHDKQFHPALLNGSEEFLDGLLRGYAWADGCIDDKSFSTVSKPLALMVHRLALNLGLSPSLYETPGRPGEIKGRVIHAIGSRYMVRFRGADRGLFDRIVGSESRPKGGISTWTAIERRDGFELLPIATLSRELHVGPVYNFEVEEDQSYVADGFAVHNCAYRASNGLSSEQFGGVDKKGNPTHNPHRMIPTEKAYEILNDAACIGIKSVTFTGGGEPTTHPDHMELFEHALNLGLDCSLNTNGNILRPGWERILPRFTYIRFSIDAGDATEYAQVRRVPESTYEKVLVHLKAVIDVCAAQKSDCLVGTGYVVSPTSPAFLTQGVRNIRNTGAKYVRLASMQSTEGVSIYNRLVMSEVRRAIEEAKELATPTFDVVSLFDEALGRRMTDPFCGFQQMVLYIGGNQKIYRCCYVAYTQLGDIGDLTDKSLAQWFASEAKMKAIEGFDARSCATCPLADKNDTILYMLKPPTHVNFV